MAFVRSAEAEPAARAWVRRCAGNMVESPVAVGDVDLPLRRLPWAFIELPFFVAFAGSMTAEPKGCLGAERPLGVATSAATRRVCSWSASLAPPCVARPLGQAQGTCASHSIGFAGGVRLWPCPPHVSAWPIARRLRLGIAGAHCGLARRASFFRAVLGRSQPARRQRGPRSLAIRWAPDVADIGWDRALIGLLSCELCGAALLGCPFGQTRHKLLGSCAWVPWTFSLLVRLLPFFAKKPAELYTCTVESGIKQGCPVSGMLLAIALDRLLRAFFLPTLRYGPRSPRFCGRHRYRAALHAWFCRCVLHGGGELRGFIRRKESVRSFGLEGSRQTAQRYCEI